MSYDPGLASRLANEKVEEAMRKGSVRAARERLQAAQMQQQLPDRSRIIGLPQRPNQLLSQFSPGQVPQQQQPQPEPPSQSPPWPLTNNADDQLDTRPMQYQTSPETRGPTPQRPPRPPRPISEDLPIQLTSPGYRDSFQSDEAFSPTSVTPSSRPLTTSSAASEASSLGDIPDFPVPQPPMPIIQPLPRRAPSLGPPPSSRRGPSSYYTQMSYVSPIVEESESRSATIRSHHGSFASSNVMPSNTNDYYLEDDEIDSDDDDDDTITSDFGRDSRDMDHDDRSELVQPALVRQVSLGRRTRPSLMTIKSVDSLSDKKASVKRKPVPAVGTSATASAIGGAVLAARDGISGQESPVLRNPPLAYFATSSNESLNSLRNIKTRFDDSDSQRGSDPEKEMLELMDTPVHPLQQGLRQGTLAQRVGTRRPPRLNVDAVHEAEARGSLTSLPELIRRATRLAANLDRGKTASRLGLDFWESGAPSERNKFDSRRSGSIRDMLAAFPPPGDLTPTGQRTPRPGRGSKTRWPLAGDGGYGIDSAATDGKADKRRRRCCGMPLWTFITLLIVLLFLVAAAVIIPIVLIVIPKMKSNQVSNAAQSNSATGTPSSTTSPAALPTATSGSNQCNGVITCQNNGVAVLNSDRTCNCVCINGFTGQTCGTQADAGCTTADIGGTNNATIGTGIPRLVNSAMNNFSISLDAPGLLSIFSNLSLSCTSENALVTFNGLASRSIKQAHLPILVEAVAEPSRTVPLLDLLHQRQAIGQPGIAQPNRAAAASASAQASSTSNQPVSSNPTAVDFARIGVLLALQETRTMDSAAKAQEAIQDFLTKNRNGNSNSNTVDLGPFNIDLVNFSIQFQNGTTIKATVPTS